MMQAVAAHPAAGQPREWAPWPGSDDQQVAGLAGGAGQDLAWLAAQHQRPGAYSGGEAAECGVERGLQPLPGVVFPEFTQLQRRVLALVQVTAGRHPGEQGDQDGIVVAGEIGRLAQRVHAAGRSAHPGEDQAVGRHGSPPQVSLLPPACAGGEFVH
jgi:hypothetical protein